MRFNKQKMLSGVLATGLALSCLVGPAFAANIKGTTDTGITQNVQLKKGMNQFTDINSSHWAYQYVDRMVQDGLFTGTSATTFSPDTPMTETQFLTVVLRKAFPDELTQYNAEFKSDWYMGAYQLGRDKGIISDSIYGTDAGAMNKRTITRERMTDMVIKTMELKGELVYGDANGVSKFVSDLGNCSSSCKDSMIKAYTMGIIAGTGGSKVSPKDTATRAQGATVLYRFAYPEERKAPDLSGVPEQPGANLEAPITIYEGQTRLQGESRLAREGDTFVKKDGTKIVLKKGPHGILGEGQGVAPDIGFVVGESVEKGWVVANQERFSPGPSLDSKYQYNSIGKSVNNDTYKIDPWTGEGHWGDEWQVLINANPLPDRKGTQDGELSSDGIWVWDGYINRWTPRCNHKNKI